MPSSCFKTVCSASMPLFVLKQFLPYIYNPVHVGQKAMDERVREDNSEYG